MSKRTAYLKLSDDELFRACEFDTFRASGPGGQKRNKTDSGVRLRHKASGLMVIAVESRSQHENRTRALRRMRMQMALSLREPIDLTDYEPTGLVCKYTRQDGHFRVSARNPEFPEVVGELLDALHACEFKVSEAAKVLRLSTSQLSRLLTSDEHVLAYVNQQKQKRGQQVLRVRNG